LAVPGRPYPHVFCHLEPFFFILDRSVGLWRARLIVRRSPFDAGPAVSKKVAGNVSQAKDIVKLPVGNKPSFGRRSKSTRKQGFFDSPAE
jgi:hypothetical protein